MMRTTLSFLLAMTILSLGVVGSAVAASPTDAVSCFPASDTVLETALDLVASRAEGPVLVVEEVSACDSSAQGGRRRPVLAGALSADALKDLMPGHAPIEVEGQWRISDAPRSLLSSKVVFDPSRCPGVGLETTRWTVAKGEWCLLSQIPGVFATPNGVMPGRLDTTVVDVVGLPSMSLAEALVALSALAGREVQVVNVRLVPTSSGGVRAEWSTVGFFPADAEVVLPAAPLEEPATDARLDDHPEVKLEIAFPPWWTRPL